MIPKKVREEILQKHTKYERARIIAARALQLELNAPFMIKIDDETLKKLNYDPVRIAELEYQKGAVPLKIRRIK